MEIVACQYDIAWEEPERNFDAIRGLLAEAPIQSDSLIVLPEMFATGFSMNVARIAESTPSLAEAFLADIAREYKSWALGGIAYRYSDDKGSNELSVYNDRGENVGHYQKNYCFSYTGESDFYASGEDILTFNWQGFTVCPVICYDLRFPELFRRGAKAGANLFPVIANWPDTRIHHWTTLLTARAIENQAYALGVNRTGSDPKFGYPGQSIAIDPHGKILASAGSNAACLRVEVDLDVVLDWREEFKALADMKEH